MGRKEKSENEPQYGCDNPDMVWYCLHCRRARCNNCMGSSRADVRAWIREDAKIAREKYEKEKQNHAE